MNVDLPTFLRNRGNWSCEGNLGEVQEQADDIAKYASMPNVRRIMEIGFNAGHSANAILSANPNATLLSFDLGIYRTVPIAKEYMDHHYPNRHTLILGDSQITVPKYVADHPQDKFDMIFIDGGHNEPIPMNDLINCMPLAHKDTILILDDIMYDKNEEQAWTVGPTRAWKQLIAEGKIVETEYRRYRHARGQAVGRYVIE